MPKKVWDAEMVARAAGLKRAGFTAKVIAERLGVTIPAVRNRMRKAQARVRLDGKGGNYCGHNNFQNGPITADIMHKVQLVDEYLERPEEEQ
jgi:DNA-binding Lrp family transcriptional regulator